MSRVLVVYAKGIAPKVDLAALTAEPDQKLPDYGTGVPVGNGEQRLICWQMESAALTRFRNSLRSRGVLDQVEIRELDSDDPLECAEHPAAEVARRGLKSTVADMAHGGEARLRAKTDLGVEGPVDASPNG